VTAVSLRADELQECQKLFLAGNYHQVAQLAGLTRPDAEGAEEWALLRIQSLFTLGRYAQACEAVTNALASLPSSVRVRLAGYEAFRHNGDADGADKLLGEINSLAGSRWAYRDATNRIALGRAALLLGADPRQVLETYYDPAKKADPNCRDVYLASGELALEKHDFDLAAKIFVEARKRFPDDPDVRFGLARAFEESDPSAAEEELETALKLNPYHIPARLLTADSEIDGEEYAQAGQTLAAILKLNPSHPEALAYRAVIAHLRGDPAAAERFRAQALRLWRSNPRVDHLIGWKLSQNYRFTEGAACQRRALQSDPQFLPAKAQLAQDLLRLGEEEEGWRLVDKVLQADAYDVVAYNLVTLREVMGKFQSLSNRQFIVRMDPREASIYGAEVLELLGRAKERLCAKYGVQLDKPITVEIFPHQKDFAIRTFGLPGGAEFLGVCFGNVITANSPASHTARAVNWQSVLWHEFTHAVTLNLTRNRMPRWLSEGVSVYEERQANPVWGEHMNAAYREMILGDALTPVGELSAAFLHPKNPRHLQFAYYQCFLVVEFLVERYGFESLKKMLHDLTADVPINQAIAKHTAPLEKIEKDFAAAARERAAKVNLTDFRARLQSAQQLVRAKKWQEAKAPLNKLIEQCPDPVVASDAYELLAVVHRGLNETDQERKLLNALAEHNADATEAYSRLMELGATAKDWPTVELNARRFLAVNPLLPQPHRMLAEAAEANGKPVAAIAAYRTLLQLDPPDPADVHFHLAKLLYAAGDPSAKRHVLMALEDAPRFRAAHKLLLEIVHNKTAAPGLKP
jgi:tetratricopeptide (TPR) repeat protein